MSDISPRGPSSLDRSSHEMQQATGGGVVRNIRVAETAVDQLAERPRNLFRRLFPDPVERERRAGELKMAKTELDAVHRTLVILRESSVQALQEAANRVLVQG